MRGHVMNRLFFVEVALCVSLGLFATGCDKEAKAKDDQSLDTGPKPASVVSELDANNFKVDHPDQFPCVKAGEHLAAPELEVTGAVNPDVSRQTPVPSLATGRIVEVDARLGDVVKKGQLLFKVRSTDVSGAYSDYRKAVRNEQLAKIQLDRAKLLFNDGAIPRSSLEVAQNNDDNAKVDLETTTEHLRLLGGNPDHPTGVVSVFAPVSGIITDQQITNQSGVQALTPQNPFTISDISHVWIMCDVYENNLAQVHVGEYADIHLAAYPERVLKGRISNILPIIDPNIRTAKVRLELENPGFLRIGMFVTATFHGGTTERRAVVPATAILHVHDREWVYTPVGNDSFRRVEIVAGGMLSDNMQEVISGVQPGEQVIANALIFQNTVEQ